MADGGGHSANLAVTAFRNRELKPLGGNRLTFADRWVPRPDRGRWYQFGFRRQGKTVFEVHALTQLLQGIVIGNMFNLYPVCFWEFVARVGNQLLHLTIVGQQEQAFTVPIQPASRVHIPDIDKVF